MFVINDEQDKSVVMKLRKYKRVELMDELSLDGDALLFPINQFLAERDDVVEYYLIDDSVNVQKMSCGKYEHERKINENTEYASTVVDKYDYLCVWPEVV
jgi:hypothetical protein